MEKDNDFIKKIANEKFAEIVNKKFTEVLERWPNAGKSQTEKVETEMADILNNFMDDDAEFGRGFTLAAIEKGLQAAVNNHDCNKYKWAKLEKESPLTYFAALAKHKSMFAFYEYLKTDVFAESNSQLEADGTTRGPELAGHIKGMLSKLNQIGDESQCKQTSYEADGLAKAMFNNFFDRGLFGKQMKKHEASKLFHEKAKEFGLNTKPNTLTRASEGARYRKWRKEIEKPSEK